MEHVPVDEDKYVTMFLGFPDCFFDVYVVPYLKALEYKSSQDDFF